MKEIVQVGDPVLRAIAQPVGEEQFGTPELERILADMTQALEEQKDGVAIAAPQIGVSLRIFLVRYDRLNSPTAGEPSTDDAPSEQKAGADLGVYINPEFVRSSRRREVMDEGCLSVRGTYGKTYRHERATVQALDAKGQRFERGGGGILAQVFQHETDHLNGILFIDHAIETYEPNKESESGSTSQPHE